MYKPNTNQPSPDADAFMSDQVMQKCHSHNQLFVEAHHADWVFTLPDL